MKYWLLLICLIVLVQNNDSAPKKSKSNGQSFIKPIKNGRNYTKNFPIFASICSSKNDLCYCGGSFLTSRLVVTAAHCLYHSGTSTLIPNSLSDMRVAYGLKGQEDVDNHQDRQKMSTYAVTSRVLKTDIFGGFAIRGKSREEINELIKLHWFYDLGIVVLDKPVQLNDDVKIVEFPTNKPEAGEELATYGYGTDQTGYIGAFKKALATVIDAEKCKVFLDHLERKYFSTYITTKVEIPYGSFFCTSSPTETSCHSDSGSPILARRSLKLKGVVSMGKKTCKKYKKLEFMNAFIDVNSDPFKSWLEQFIEMFP